MSAVAAVVLAWLVFGGSHIGLATAPVRAPLVAKLGPRGFMIVYIAIASALFIALVWTYAAVAADGPAGPDLARTWARGPLIVAIVIGFALMAGAFAPTGYWDSPVVVLGDGVRAPVGLERITRHPFFTGFALIAGAHVLLASRLTGVVFFGGFIALATLGAAHQAGKLRRERGPAFDDYLAQSSSIPFVAIARGRQRFVARELPWLYLALGVGLAAAVHEVHADVLAHHGAGISGVAVGASIAIGVIQTIRSKKK